MGGTVLDFTERPAAPAAGSVTDPTRAQLDAAGHTTTALGQAALILAAHVDSGIDSGATANSSTERDSLDVA